MKLHAPERLATKACQPFKYYADDIERMQRYIAELSNFIGEHLTVDQRDKIYLEIMDMHAFVKEAMFECSNPV